MADQNLPESLRENKFLFSILENKDKTQKQLEKVIIKAKVFEQLPGQPLLDVDDSHIDLSSNSPVDINQLYSLNDIFMLDEAQLGNRIFKIQILTNTNSKQN